MTGLRPYLCCGVLLFSAGCSPAPVVALGANAAPAVPALLKALRDDDRGVYLEAARALRRIDPKAADRAGMHE
jgi:hypothetical protein